MGPTILETSMLLAGEEVVAFRDNQKASQFGTFLGPRRGCLGTWPVCTH